MRKGSLKRQNGQIKDIVNIYFLILHVYNFFLSIVKLSHELNKIDLYVNYLDVKIWTEIMFKIILWLFIDGGECINKCVFFPDFFQNQSEAPFRYTYDRD